MSKFHYLGGAIPFAFAVVFIVLLIVGLIFTRQTCCGRKQEVPLGDNPRYSQWQRFFYGYPYEYVYESSWKNLIGDSVGMYLLLIWRFASFCFFFGIVFLYGYVKSDGGNAHFFTLWNIDLFSAYYFIATIASVIGIVNHQGFLQHKEATTPTSDYQLEAPSYWSRSMIHFGYAIQILYEVTGSTAFFVTVITFVTLNRRFEFWNVSQHFMTTMSILLELGLNRMVVRWEHLVFTVLWALMYLIFIWPLVAMGDLTNWPYFFLETDSAAVFAWYIGLIVLLIIFYFVFWFVSWLRELLVGALEMKYHVVSANSPTRRQRERELELEPTHQAFDGI